MTVATRPEPRRGSPGCGELLDYEAQLIAKWRAASFDRACELAVGRGLVRDLGLGFYATPARTQAPNDAHGDKEDGPGLSPRSSSAACWCS